MPSPFPARMDVEFDEAMECLDFSRAQEIINDLRALGHPCVWMQKKLNLEKSIIDGTYEDFSSGSDITRDNEPAYDRE